MACPHVRNQQRTNRTVLLSSGGGGGTPNPTATPPPTLAPTATPAPAPTATPPPVDPPPDDDPSCPEESASGGNSGNNRGIFASILGFFGIGKSAQTQQCIPPPNITVVASVNIASGSTPYTTGQTLAGQFTIKNNGDVAVTLNPLVLGGRLNGDDTCSNYIGGACPDFNPVSVTLNPGATYTYYQTFVPKLPGTYSFQVFFQTTDGKWYWNLGTENGANNSVTVEVSIEPSIQGLQFLGELEGGFHEFAYNDLGDNDPNSKCTIGYGRVLFFRPCTEEETQTISTTEPEERQFLENRSQENADKILELVQTPLNQQQFDALIAFMYNLGTNILTVGDPEQILLNYLNNGQLQEVPGEMKLYNKSGGEYVQGLQNRRCDEADLFETGDYSGGDYYPPNEPCPRAD
jgi:lysozyme